MPNPPDFQPIQIGDRARDSITGLTGIVTNVSRWLHGRIRVGIQPEALHEGRPVPEQYFDQMWLVMVDRSVHQPLVQMPPRAGLNPVEEIYLGDRVKDPITGLIGIVTCHTTWLYGCLRLGVQPETTHDGSPVEDKYFDAAQLIVVDRQVHQPVALGDSPGQLPLYAPDLAAEIDYPGLASLGASNPAAPSDYDGDGGTTETPDRLVSGDAGGDDGPATPAPATGPTTPPDATDSLAASIRQPVATDQPSAGPWVADRLHQTECGAVRILDNRGNTIGWATDTMGHTLDPAVPVGIHRNDIVLNAGLMALGPDAIALCRLIRTVFPAYREQMQVLGWPPHAEMEAAFDMAGGMLRRAGGLHDVP